jgi:hypothetical protein
MSLIIVKYTQRLDMESRLQRFQYAKNMYMLRSCFSKLASDYYKFKEKEEKVDKKVKKGVFYGWFEAASRRMLVKKRLEAFFNLR